MNGHFVHAPPTGQYTHEGLKVKERRSFLLAPVFFSKRHIVIGLSVALVAGLLHALPVLGLPSANALASAARGLASSRGLEGYGQAGIGDKLAGWLWQTGGAPALTAGEFARVFVGWTLGLLVALAIMETIARMLHHNRTRRILFTVTFALIAATCVSPIWAGLIRRPVAVSDLSLMAPKALATEVEKREAAQVFANASALPHLVLFAPGTVGGVSPITAGQLVSDPAAWREALRKSQWEAVVLSGPVEEYRRLLEHLITSPDWRLAVINNQGYLFLRGDGPVAKSIDVDKFSLGSDHATAVYLAQIAGYYDAVRRTGEARKCIARALDLAPNEVTVLAHAGTYALAHKRWQEAINYSNKALAQNPHYPHAKLVKAVALQEVGEPHRAMPLVDEVLLQAPDDLYSLFLKAKISRSLNDYVAEADTLEKIIAVSDRAGLPSMHYRIYLGQAYAKQGQPKPALENYKLVLASGTLNKEQAAEIQDAITTIEAKIR